MSNTPVDPVELCKQIIDHIASAARDGADVEEARDALKKLLADKNNTNNEEGH